LIKRKRNVPKASQGRKSIVPGSVVILLSGVSRGRRVVVLKTLASGNLLVTGPYAINGVPLRRVNPAYVISTSLKVSLDGVNVNVDDSFFKNHRLYTKNELKNASEARLKKVDESKIAENKWRADLKAVQKAIDGKLVENIKKVEHLSGYLDTRFTLSNGTRPHELKF
jgi:large subunit ribosomal protein L6e